MVNQDQMWENIRAQLAQRHSPEVVQLLQKYVLLMPIALRDILESPVTIEGVLKARIAYDEYLSKTKLASEFAHVEINHPSSGYGEGFSPSVADLEEFVAFRLSIQIEQARGYLGELQHRLREDSEYLRKDHPSWSREQQLLYHTGVGVNLIALHQQGKLTFAKLLEASPDMFFVYLGR